MPNVFVSYKREDAGRVGKLVAALRACGLDAWWDEDIPASAPWEATIERALKEAKTVIVCWSPASVSSENVRAEARVAREDGRLVQVFVERCTPPLFFGERQGVDLSGWRGNPEDERIRDILKTVAQMTPARSRDASVAIEPGGARKGRPLRMIAAALALILLVGGMAG